MEMGKILPQVQKLWDTVELRVLVLVSLFIQTVLIFSGNRRKYIKSRLVAGILWLFYLSADSVATVALGVLSRGQNDAKSNDAKSQLDPSYTIMAFWAPFLLMHLGGPDTITAYSWADNELWARHLLGLGTQVALALYVLLRSWTGTHINFVWIVVFVGGFAKYGERTWVLYSASKNRFRESLVSRPDPGPDYAKLMDEVVCKEREGYGISLREKVINTVSTSSWPRNSSAPSIASGARADINVLQEAYNFFATFKKLFADLILSFQDKEKSLSFFKVIDADKAFSIVEVELGLVYDLFYTKALMLYSWLGFLLRTLSCSFTVTAFVAFLIINKNAYPRTEVIITYILFGGAIFLEIYAVLILLSSDWVMIWLNGNWTTIPAVRKFKDFIASPIQRVVLWLQKLHIVPARRRWSTAVGQYNVLDYCIKSKRRFAKIRQHLEEYLFWNSASIPKGLKELIFEELKTRVDIDEKKGGSYRGDRFLIEERKCFANVPNGLKALIFDELKGSVIDIDDKKMGHYRGDEILFKKLMNHYDKDDEDYELEFDQSVLLWHMATDLCFHTDVDEERDKTWLYKLIENGKMIFKDNLKFKREMCVLLSNYMMHLLIKSPSMLPSGIGQIRFQDTCAEATYEFFNKKEFNNKKEACKQLRQVDVRFHPSKVKGDRSKSLLFDSCRLAESLQSLQDVDQRWEIITLAWLDLLTYAAAQCSWSDHAEKLSQGGELLTHVWLLMAHFGMTDHFQISQGYVRAKLILS